MPKQQNAPETSQEAITAPQDEQGTLTPAAEPEAPQSPPSAPPAATVGDTLSDDEKQRIANLVKASGGRRSGLYKLPDGSIRMDITIPVEYAASLEAQAEGAEIPLEKYVQDAVLAALEAYYAAPA